MFEQSKNVIIVLATWATKPLMKWEVQTHNLGPDYTKRLTSHEARGEVTVLCHAFVFIESSNIASMLEWSENVTYSLLANSISSSCCSEGMCELYLSAHFNSGDIADQELQAWRIAQYWGVILTIWVEMLILYILIWMDSCIKTSWHCAVYTVIQGEPERAPSTRETGSDFILLHVYTTKNIFQIIIFLI